MAESIIDRAALEALIEDLGAEDTVAVVDTYLNDAPEQLRKIQSALPAGDSDMMARAAHSLKSTSLMVGATKLAELSMELEARARADDLTALEGTVAALASQLASARAELLAARNRLGDN